MVSVFETFLEQTIGASITICTEAWETLLCNMFGVQMWQPFLDAICATLTGGK